MPEITAPASLAFRSLTVTLGYPGRVTLASPFTQDAVIVDRGNGQWSGEAEIRPVHAEDANPLDAFLNLLNDRRNWAELPLGSRASTFAATTVSAVSANTITLAALPAGLELDGYVRSGNRLYQVTSLASATRQITVQPSGILAASAAISPASTIRARLAKEVKALPRANGIAGPRRIEFIEAV